ncbi:MAG TPA: ATP-binding protein [Deltaproteobacteria bacterium]|nr:ATP-binding protein [Deltaproteobacteria bacterium]HPR53577.1 ATP-binding protein [Deltaproteobacteria bacterium]HXK47632.1 ATP-binding protein [Deltaproteobacteria bacterium]
MKDHFDQVRSVFENAPFAVCAFDRSGTVIYINKLLESNMEPSALPFVGKSLYELIHTFLVDDRLEKMLKRLIETNKPFSLIVETLSSPRVKVSGLINITGYRLNSLYVLLGDFVSGGLAREGRYRKLIEDAPDAILIMNHGFITFANPAFVDIMQNKPEEILGKSIFDLVDERGREDIAALRRKTAKKFFAQIAVNTKTGQKVLEGNFHFIEDRPGTSIAMLRDVTEKVLLQRRLMRQNQDLAAVNTISKTLSSSIELKEVLQNTLEQVLQIMNIEMGLIYVLDEKRKTLRCELFHGMPEEVMQTVRELKLGEGIAGRVAISGKPMIIENASLDNRIQSIAFRQQGIRSFASIPIQSRTRLLGVMNIGSFGQRTISPEDERLLITIGVHMGAVMENIYLFQEISRTSDELKDALNLIRQRNEELRQLVSTVSHDLKNPIIAINGFCDRFMKSAAAKLSSKELQYIEAIHDSGRHMEEFVTNLLTLSAVENLKLKKEEFPTREIVDEIIMELATRIDEKKGKVVTAEDLPAIKADRIRITQVFSNLISNAVKYSHPDRVPVISIGYETLGNMHIFSVKDNGVGIPEEHTGNIFDIFYRVSDNHVEGTGIGLSIVKKALQVMGGDIWVKSKPGRGSTFYFSLPME